MAIEIKVPTLGESVSEATVARWLKAEGDPVAADEPLVELETDKVTLEVPAPGAGRLGPIATPAGSTVAPGALLGTVEDGAGAAKAAAPSKPAPEKVPPKPAASPGNGAAAPDASARLVDIVTPSAGESVTEAEVGQWLKKAGEAVALDEVVVELQTDKATQEINAQVAGTLAEIAVETGGIVRPGDVLGRIRPGAATGASGGSARPVDAGPEEMAPRPPEAAAARETQQERAAPKATEMPPAPAAAKMMADRGVDPAAVEGTGRRGQVLKGDVIAALERGDAAPAGAAPRPTPAPAPVPAPAAKPKMDAPAGSASDAGEEHRVRMTRLRQTIARRLKDAQNTAAMLTTFNDVDMSAVMALRSSYKDLFEKRHGVKLGFMGFFVKAAVAALKDVPAVNAEIDGEDIVFKNYYNIAVAVGTDKGLVVPVIRNAQDLSIAAVEKTIGDFGKRARDGQLRLDEMQGGTFTITNGGVYGSLMSTPILNAPQSGILGMHRIEERPVVRDKEIVVRPMMYLALSYDHRIVDGKDAVTFLVRIKEAIEDPQRLVLDL